MSSPIFVLGNPRSGTTLLRLMLNNHKNIVIPPECGFAIWFYEKYANTIINESIIREFIKDISTARKIETWGLNFYELEIFIVASKPDSYSKLVSCVYEFYGKQIGKNFKRWGDKNNFYIKHIETINKLFPSAYFIHIVRDGRDVACSYRSINRSKIVSKYAPHLPDDIISIAEEWDFNLNQMIDSFNKISWHNVYEVRYEDLTTSPVDTLRNICNFLEEPYDERMETYYLKNQEEQQEPVEFLQWKVKTLEKPTTSEISKYLKELRKNEIKQFENIAHKLLERYSYLP